MTRNHHAAWLTLVALILISDHATAARGTTGRRLQGTVRPLARPAFEKSTDIALQRCRDHVVVLCCSTPDDDWPINQAAFMKGLAGQLADQFSARGIRIIDNKQVADWLDEHPNWNTPEEIGAGVGAKYVIRIDVDQIRRRDPNTETTSKSLQSLIQVVEVHSFQHGERIFNTKLQCEFPCANSDSANKQAADSCLQHLGNSIGRIFYPHLPPVKLAGTSD